MVEVWRLQYEKIGSWGLHTYSCGVGLTPDVLA